jgi:hypothetical protein
LEPLIAYAAYAAVFAVAGLSLRYVARRRAYGRRVRELRQHRRVARLADCPSSGPVLVSGQVAALRRVRAPLSGTEVVGWHLAVACSGTNRYGRSYRKKLYDDGRCGDFRLVDGETGLDVLPGGSQVMLRFHRVDSGPPHKVPAAIASGLQARRIKLPANCTVEWAEAWLEDGEQVDVYAWATRAASPATAVGYRVATRGLRLTGDGSHRGLVTTWRDAVARLAPGVLLSGDFKW